MSNPVLEENKFFRIQFISARDLAANRRDVLVPLNEFIGHAMGRILKAGDNATIADQLEILERTRDEAQDGGAGEPEINCWKLMCRMMHGLQDGTGHLAYIRDDGEERLLCPMGEERQAECARAERELQDAQMGEDSGEMGEDSREMGEDSGDMGEDSGDMGEDNREMGEDNREMGEDGGDMGEDGGDMGEDGGDVKEENRDLKEDEGESSEDKGGPEKDNCDSFIWVD